MVFSIQLIVYLPIYNVDFPPNLLIFLESLRKIATGKIIETKELFNVHVKPLFTAEVTEKAVLEDTYKSAGFDSFSITDNL
tara:strand:+ start:234 stop:476 length:243 start_codon:yes stop_codon:yes gene_type:complete